MNPAALSLKNRKVVLVAMLLFIIAGAAGYYKMPRQEDPDIIPSWATVFTGYPGAGPEKVEQLVTRVLEKRISEMDDIKELTSYSQEGGSIIVVHLEDGADREKSWDALREKVDAARAEMPTDTREPDVNTRLSETITMMISVESHAYSYSQLSQYAEQVKRRLEPVRGVARVDLVGEPEEEVTVMLDWRWLSEYDVPPTQIFAALQGRNNLIPGGSWPSDGFRNQVITSGQYGSLQEIAGTVVAVSDEGYPIRLDHVAKVERLPNPSPTYIRSNGNRAVILTITAKEGLNVVKLGRQVREQLSGFSDILPGDVKVKVIVDQPLGIEERLSNFSSSLIFGMLLVIIVVLTTMGVRSAVIISISIPFSILLSFALMPVLGIKLHQVSIAALVISLGMLVDNAIVITDNIDRLLVAGIERREAVIRGVGEVGTAVLTATLTTVGAFIPLMLMQGDTGDFIRDIPQVVSLALLASLLVSVTVTPLFGYNFLKQKKAGVASIQVLRPAEEFYRRILAASLKRPGITLFLAITALGISFVAIPLLGLQFFPPADRNQLIIDVNMPRGTDIKVNDEVSSSVESILMEQSQIENFTAFIGRGIPKFYYNELPPRESSDITQILITLKDNSRSDEDVEALIYSLRHKFAGEIAGARIEVRRLEQGPPVGAAIAVRIGGDDLDTLQTLSRQVQEMVQQVSGTVGVSTDIQEVPLLRVEVDPSRAALSGLTNYDVSLAVRAATEGLHATDYQEGSKELPVVMRYYRAGMEGLGGLESLFVTSPVTGANVPLKEIARVFPEWEVAEIIRYNNQRTVTVRANVEGRLPAEVQQDIENRLESLDLPKGYFITYGGENEDRDASFASLGNAAIIAVLVIYLLLVIQFNSLIQPIVVLSTIPLALFGAVIGLWVTGNPVGFMALLGIVSLSGIVVNNAIVLLEFINALRRNSIPLTEAIMEAGRQRFRPIMLTTLTTVGGLLPLTVSGGKLWGPMGWSIIFGLLGSTLLTLVVVPALYLLTESRAEKIQVKKMGVN
ncbi:MAG: efflux RND transporter permease subunit [Bacillota bacterium]